MTEGGEEFDDSTKKEVADTISLIVQRRLGMALENQNENDDMRRRRRNIEDSGHNDGEGSGDSDGSSGGGGYDGGGGDDGGSKDIHNEENELLTIEEVSIHATIFFLLANIN